MDRINLDERIFTMKFSFNFCTFYEDFWHSFISVDDLVDLLSKSRNGSTLDYELFKKTDQVDSFLRQVNWKSWKSSEEEMNDLREYLAS